MTVTDIKIRKEFPEGPLAAIYSVTFDNELVVHDIKIIRRDDGFMLVMPSRRTNDGTFKDIVHPVNSVFRKKLEEQIMKFYGATKDAE